MHKFKKFCLYAYSTCVMKRDDLKYVGLRTVGYYIYAILTSLLFIFIKSITIFKIEQVLIIFNANSNINNNRPNNNNNNSCTIFMIITIMII